MEKKPNSMVGTTPWDRSIPTTDGLQLLLDSPNMPGCSCVGRHETFDLAADGDPVAQKRALEICAQCPQLTPCKQWAAEQLTSRQRRALGVVGGRCHVQAKPSAASKARRERERAKSSARPKATGTAGAQPVQKPPQKSRTATKPPTLDPITAAGSSARSDRTHRGAARTAAGSSAGTGQDCTVTGYGWPKDTAYCRLKATLAHEHRPAQPTTRCAVARGSGALNSSHGQHPTCAVPPAVVGMTCSITPRSLIRSRSGKRLTCADNARRVGNATSGRNRSPAPTAPTWDASAVCATSRPTPPGSPASRLLRLDAQSHRNSHRINGQRRTPVSSPDFTPEGAARVSAATG